MAIDPDVQVKIDALTARVVVLEARPVLGDHLIMSHTVQLANGQLLTYNLA